MHILSVVALLLLPVFGAAPVTLTRTSGPGVDQASPDQVNAPQANADQATTVDPNAALQEILAGLPWSTDFWAAPPPVQGGTPLKGFASGKAELSFVNTSGNSSTQTIGTAGLLELRPGAWLIASDTSFVRTTTEDEVQAESLTSELRVARKLSAHVDAYGQGRYLRNTFAGLRHQKSLEFGLSTRLLQEKPHRLRAEAALGYIDEDRVEGDDRILSSGTLGLRYAWNVTKTSEFTQDTIITGNLRDGNDWRLRNAASLAAHLNTIFSLKFSHVLTYLREPVPGFEQSDRISSAALVAKF
jgi:putative salt-induced outer membrane protein